MYDNVLKRNDVLLKRITELEARIENIENSIKGKQFFIEKLYNKSESIVDYIKQSCKTLKIDYNEIVSHSRKGDLTMYRTIIIKLLFGNVTQNYSLIARLFNRTPSTIRYQVNGILLSNAEQEILNKLIKKFKLKVNDEKRKR